MKMGTKTILTRKNGGSNDVKLNRPPYLPSYKINSNVMATDTIRNFSSQQPIYRLRLLESILLFSIYQISE